MALKLTNTLTKKKEAFKPIEKGKVNMFVCGPTVYDYSHLGHAKVYTQFDFICRYLRKKGYDVFYLMNITDIDDKIIKKAQEEKKEPKAVAERFEAIFIEDMKALHNTSVTKYARASDFIDQIVKQVKTLIDKGYAYTIEDGIYYDLKKFKDYGKLSGRTTLQEDDAVSRIDENTQKRNKGDFCLWKFHKPGEPFWETELGKGRPGWHIEDTAITEHYFGTQYDIHGASVDLIFPHHEAEIAQQEAASEKKPFVRYWLHTAFLNINKEKMSKSKHNFLTIRDLLEKYPYQVLRFFFISNHYRTTIDFSPDLMDQAKNGLQRVNDFIFNADMEHDDKVFENIISEYRAKFYAALDDDLDTPKAYSILFDFIRKINAEGKAGKSVIGFMKEVDEIFDFMQFEKDSIPEEIIKLKERRDEARRNKDWKESDEIRDTILKKGYQVLDSKEGTEVRKR